MSNGAAKRNARTVARFRDIVSADPPKMSRRARARLRKCGDVGALGTGKIGGPDAR